MSIPENNSEKPEVISAEDQRTAYYRALIALVTRELIEENREEILRRAHAKHEENRKKTSSEA